MATFKDKKSQKVVEFTNHTTISASAAAGGLINGKVANFVGVDKIPYRLKQGDQSSYFDITKVETGSIVRTDDGVVYVPYKKKNWQDMLIGNNSEAKSRFSDTAYQQISSAFASKISNIDDDFIMTQVVEEFYTASAEAFVGPVTASFTFTTANNATQSYSGIDYGSGVDFNINNNSSYVTHTSLQIGLSPTVVTQSIFLTSSLFNLTHSGSLTSSFTSTNNTYSTPVSGTAIGLGSVKNINGENVNSGIYAEYALKSKIAGDADSGSLYTFGAGELVIIYDSSHARFELASGSFQYSSVTQSAATGSGVFKTLYYHRAQANAGPSASFTGSLASTPITSSSPLHGDSGLRTSASFGYYHVPGTTDVYEVSSSLAFTIDRRNSFFVSKVTL